MNQIIRYSAIAVFLLCTAGNALAVDCFVQTYPATPGTTVVNVANEYCTDVQAWLVGTDMNVACAPNNSWAWAEVGQPLYVLEAGEEYDVYCWDGAQWVLSSFVNRMQTIDPRFADWAYFTSLVMAAGAVAVSTQPPNYVYPDGPPLPVQPIIGLPPGFDVSQLATDFLGIISPFVGIVFLISSGFFLMKILRRA